jgi:hypothetical protein
MHRIRKVLLGILIVFLLPLAVHAALYVSKDRPASFRDADWSSVGMLPPADADREARFLVFTGRTGRWKGIFAVHSWVVFKPENATTWSRYDVVGWGQPLRTNAWAPDGRWFGDAPRVLIDVRGAAAADLIPKVKAAINTFTTTVLRAVPELAATLPSNAVGKDFRGHPYVGLTDSGTGVEASLWGLLGMKLGWVEGLEVNVLGLVAGLDLRHPAVKLPGFGRIGVADGSAIAAPARAN